jgi:hypothetical protein
VETGLERALKMSSVVRWGFEAMHQSRAQGHKEGSRGASVGSFHLDGHLYTLSLMKCFPFRQRSLLEPASIERLPLEHLEELCKV